MTHRKLGSSELAVSSIGFGCWPIAGVSSLGVTDQASLTTLEAAVDVGINFFDTAYSYGYEGQADRLLKQVIAGRRQDLIIASKAGSHYDSQRQRHVDGRPEVLLRQIEESIQRLGIEWLDLIYLHQPDPAVPIEESAGAIARSVERGLARYAAVSNVTLQQLTAFHNECPVIAVQQPYNMLQQESWLSLRHFCDQHKIACVAYWVLMKGLLAGKMSRDHHFDPRDRRLTYPIFQGQAWQSAQNLLDRLREIAARLECTVAQLVVAWTLCQPGISVALCGAKRPDQIVETATAMALQLDQEILDEIDGLIQANFQAATGDSQ